MGAISASSSVPILRTYLSDPERTVRETCEIAIAKIEWDNSEEGHKHLRALKDSVIPYACTLLYCCIADFVTASTIQSTQRLRRQNFYWGHLNWTMYLRVAF